MLLDALQSTLNKQGFFCFYFWTANTSGRTHLLHAASQNRLASYIPLKQHLHFSPDILSGLNCYDVVCLDDIDAIAGDRNWEERIFDLFNQLIEQNISKLLITASAPPKHIQFTLPDLVSRLSWGQVHHLKELNDEGKLNMLQLMAELKGFELPTEVGIFLLKRVERDINSLFLALEKLEVASLVEQRKLTIPFTKQILDL